jgi:hypothetical protein
MPTNAKKIEMRLRYTLVTTIVLALARTRIAQARWTTISSDPARVPLRAGFSAGMVSRAA